MEINCFVVLFWNSYFQVTVELENGEKYDGDLLVGADGIWSKVLFNIL